MKGDIIIVENHHYYAVNKIVPKIIPIINNNNSRFIITVAGESGSGKSETAIALSVVLEKNQIKCSVLQQDDYFAIAPKTNDRERRKDISKVGPKEVNLERLDCNILSAKNGQNEIEKPIINYTEDKIEEEIVILNEIKVIIAEGTYTSLLQNVDLKIFIDRDRIETLESRKKRGREPIDPFIEKVLEIEHNIISKHKKLAEIIITNDYNVNFAS